MRVCRANPCGVIQSSPRKNRESVHTRSYESTGFGTPRESFSTPARIASTSELQPRIRPIPTLGSPPFRFHRSTRLTLQVPRGPIRLPDAPPWLGVRPQNTAYVCVCHRDNRLARFSCSKRKSRRTEAASGERRIWAKAISRLVYSQSRARQHSGVPAPLLCRGSD